MPIIPVVVESDGKYERSYDIYSRLLKDRIIMLGTDFHDGMASSIVSQLLFLASQNEKKDIQIYLNSPGGNVTSGLAIYDTIRLIKPDVSITCIGQACSMGAFILSSGTKGKRYATEESRIMIHQVSGGAQGTNMDVEITLQEMTRLNTRLTQIMASNCDKTFDEVKNDMSRDKWFSAEQAKEYGLIDEVRKPN